MTAQMRRDQQPLHFETNSKSTEAYKLSFYLNTFLIIFLIAGSLVSFFIGPWIEKANLLYTMKVRMTDVVMGPGAVSAGLSIMLSEAASKKLSQWDHERTYDFDEFHAWVCQVPASVFGASPCPLWDGLKAANYTLIICGVFGMALLLSAWIMEYFYISKPKKESKKIMRILYGIGAFLMVVGMAVYYYNAYQMKEMIPRSEANVLTKNFTLCLCCVMLSPAPLIIQIIFAPTSEDELENECLSAEKKNLREAERQKAWEDREFGAGGYAGQQQPSQGQYGAIGAQQPMMMGGQQPMMMQQPMMGGVMVVGGPPMGLPTQHGQGAW